MKSNAPELDEEVKKELKLAEKEYTKGEFLTLSEVKKKLKLEFLN